VLAASFFSFTEAVIVSFSLLDSGTIFFEAALALTVTEWLTTKAAQIKATDNKIPAVTGKDAQSKIRIEKKSPQEARENNKPDLRYQGCLLVFSIPFALQKALVSLSIHMASQMGIAAAPNHAAMW